MLMEEGNKAMNAAVFVSVYTASDALVLTKQETLTPYKPTERTKKIDGVKLKEETSLKTPFYRYKLPKQKRQTSALFSTAHRTNKQA
jgi:hypothetical protein